MAQAKKLAGKAVEVRETKDKVRLFISDGHMLTEHCGLHRTCAPWLSRAGF